MAEMVVRRKSANRILMKKLFEELLLIRLRRISKDKVSVVLYS
jgi:hypothetical protein